jgi:hypothetical protein
MLCEWCGGEHDQAALCRSRPKFSRRGFLALFGAGIAGVAAAQILPTGLCVTDVVGPLPVVIRQRKLMGRIRLTPEALIDSVYNGQGAFSIAVREEWRSRIEAITQALDADLIRDSRAAHPADSPTRRLIEP